jgi:membrane associated rhomboid family serine protease
MIIPIGRDVGLTKFPWVTSLLILVNMAVFLNTWPDEKKFLSARWPSSPLVTDAKALADIALERGTTLPVEIRTRLEDLRGHPHFPDLEADRILESIHKNFLYLPTLRRPYWNLKWPAYIEDRRRLKEDGTPWESVFLRWAYRPNGPPWPGILTHLFLHAGLWHLLFNMLFLWLVGCNIEERWGPFIFLFLFFSGGMLAALAESYILGSSDLMMVGASGAVAAVMGGFLVRHFQMRIRFLAILGITYWKFWAPAWVALPLWFGGEVFMGVITSHQLDGGVAHWAHAAGFIYGVLMGLVVRGRITQSWEQEANRTPVALDQGAARAAQLIGEGKAAEAEVLLRDVLETDPQHLAGLRAMLAVHEFFQREDEAAHTAVRIIRVSLEGGQGRVAEEVFRVWSLKLFQSSLSAQERLTLAQNLETLQLYREALAYYRAVSEKFKGSSFAGKALYASAHIMRDQLKKPDEAAASLKLLLDPPYDLEWGPLAEADLRAMGKL